MTPAAYMPSRKAYTWRGELHVWQTVAGWRWAEDGVECPESFPTCAEAEDDATWGTCGDQVVTYGPPA